MKRIYAVFCVLGIGLTGTLFPENARAEDLRRLIVHRDVWVENIGSCPTELTDRMINIFREQGRRVRRINVNPHGRESSGNCKVNSVFQVFLNSDDREFTYPGYTRYVERNGRFVPHSWGEVADLSFQLNDPLIRVVEIIQGSIFMTAMNSHRVNVAQNAALTSPDIERIVAAVHERYQPGLERRIKGDFFIRGTGPGRVTVNFIDFKDKERTYGLEKAGREWRVVGSDGDSQSAQRPLGGSS